MYGVKIVNDNRLQCPYCDEDTGLHQAAVDVFFQPEDTPVDGIHINHSNEVSLSDKTNPSWRRSGLTLTFWCENCCPEEVPKQDRHILYLNIYQHKGVTCMEWFVSNKVPEGFVYHV